MIAQFGEEVCGLASRSSQMAGSLPEYPLIDDERLHEHQFSDLQRLIKRVYRKSGFYRDKFDAAGLKPEDIQTIADFARIPFTALYS